MQPKHNIDNYMKEYEDLLGGPIDVEAVGMEDDDDPELKAYEAQIAKLNRANQGQGVQKEDDEVERMMRQYEKGTVVSHQADQLQEFLAPQSKPKPQPAQKGNDLEQLEKEVTKISEMTSLAVLRADIDYIDKSILPNIKTKKDLVQLYTSVRDKLNQEMKSLCEKLRSEQLDEEQYTELAMSAFQAQQKIYKEASNPAIKPRIAERCKALSNELKRIKAKEFEKIMQEFGCSADIGTKFLIQELDSKPHLLKAEELFRRHKQYLNLAKYYSEHLKKEKEVELQELIRILEVSKKYQNEFFSGQNPNIAKFILKEMKELTEEQFLGCSRIEFQARLKQLIDQVQSAQQDEQLYYKVASLAKPQLVKVPGQKQMVAVSPAEASKQNLMRYDEYLKYFDELKKSTWTPLPIFQVTSEQRQFSTDNKDIPANTLRISFKKLSTNDKYFLVYSIDLSRIIQEKTAVAERGVLNHLQDVNLSDQKNCFNQLNLKKIDIKLIKKGFFSDDEKGRGEISLSSLLEVPTIEGELTLHKDISLSYVIQIRESLNKKKAIKVAAIIKQLPQFDPNKDCAQAISEKMAQVPKELKQTVPEAKDAQPLQTQQQQQQIQQQAQGSKQEEEEQQQGMPELIDPRKLMVLAHTEQDEEFKRVKQYNEQNPGLDLLLADDPVRGPVFFFIQPYEPFLKDQIVIYAQDVSQRAQSRFMQKLWESYYTQKLKLTKQLETDQGQQIYCKNLASCIQRDQELVKILSQIGAPKWAEFVQQRLSVALREQQEFS